MALEINATLGLTDALHFQPKAASVASRSVRTIIQPTSSGAQTPGSIVRFQFPTGAPNQFLDPQNTYLSFTVTNNDPTAATTMTVAGSAYSFISRADTFSAGGLKDSIPQYGVLVNALLDLQYKAGAGATAGNVMFGTSSNATATIDRTGISIPTGGSADFTLPLACLAVIGTNNKKMLPLSKLQNLELQLYMESVLHAVTTASTTCTFNFSNMAIIANYINLDPGMARVIEQQNGGRYVISSSAWQNVQYTPSAGRTQDAFLVPGKYQSLTGALVTYRDAAHMNVQTDNSITARVNPFSSATGLRCQVQWRLGSTYVPAQPIAGVVELFANTHEFLHALADVDHGGRINLANYSQAAYAGGGATMGAFVLGQNFTSTIGKSATITSGMDTYSTTTVLSTVFPQSNPLANVVDIFCNFDYIIEITDAGMQVRY